MRRNSLKSMMWYLAFIAVGLAALRNANEIWAGAMLLIVSGALGAAVLGIIYRSGRERAGWVGFVLFLGGYSLLAFAPWFSSEVKPHMGTSKLLDLVCTAGGPPSLHYVYLGGNPNDVDVQNYIIGRIKELTAQGTEAYAELRSLREDLLLVEDRLIEQGSALTNGKELSLQWRVRSRLQRIMPGHSYPGEFKQVAHCLFALLAGLIGAFISSRMYREPAAATE